MINLLEYSQSYSMTSGSLWNYYRDKIDDVDNNDSDGKSSKYKTKIIEKTEARLINKPFLISQWKTNKMPVKNLLKCQ